MWYFAAGDAGFYFPEQLHALSWLPQVWHPEFGFGVSTLARLWFDYPYQVLLKFLSTIGLSWWMIDKILWFGMFILGAFSSFRLAQYIFGSFKIALVSSFIYVTNTYSLLLFAGGQIGVGLAYAFSPFVLLKFIQLIHTPLTNRRPMVISGICLALLAALDLRISFLINIGIIFYALLFIRNKKLLLDTGLKYFLALCITAILHSFWIIPLLFGGYGALALDNEFTDPGMLKFLSVADFSHTLSLLHPNWPENLFGKVYLLQPEFLFIPLFAFSGLLFLKFKNNSIQSNTRIHVIYFLLLSLMGVFLAKGTHDPFGWIFEWMFTYIPGFVLFRDPTKFFVFIAIGYSMLIAYVLKSFAIYLMNTKNLRYKKTAYYLPILLFICIWLVLIRALFNGQVKGNFQPLFLTLEFNLLKEKLAGDPIPSRVLWIPQSDKFAYISEMHPLIHYREFFSSNVGDLDTLVNNKLFEQRIGDAGVGYIIIPQDLEQKIFLDNYKPAPDQRVNLIETIKKSNLKQDTDFRNLAVFSNSQFTMSSVVPESVAKLQELSTIGAGISFVFLLLLSTYIFFSKKI